MGEMHDEYSEEEDLSLISELRNEGHLPPLDHSIKELPTWNPGASRATAVENSDKRKREYLKAIAHGMTVLEAAEHVGISMRGVLKYRTDQVFRYNEKHVTRERTLKDDPDAHTVMGFEDFRKQYYKRDTPTFQKVVVDAYENTPLGNVTMILLPPEHGKTTLFEDFASYKLAIDSDFRFIVAGSTAALGVKIIARVMRRMQPDGPFPNYVKEFGPFAPQPGRRGRANQPWTANAFNVYKREAFDERDYSMCAIGIKGEVTGARCEHLHGDDLQSMRTLNLTPSLVEAFRQDWLSRPGENGRTTINGTRVGDGDFYEVIENEIDDSSILKVIKMPALIPDPLNPGDFMPLWPREPRKGNGYTMNMLERMRKKVGEDAWARNYMQHPRARTLGTFSEQIFDECVNPNRRFGENAVENAPFYIGLDPALSGKNCFVAMQTTADMLYITDIIEHSGLQRNEQIFAILEILVRQIKARDGHVQEVVIESMNFQRGLARDERLKEIAAEHGFQIREHLTGDNKMSEDIGVPSMATTFQRHEIDVPGDPNDLKTSELLSQYRDQFLRWTPFVKGKDLRQDQVMATWFPWLLWQNRRRIAKLDTGQFQAKGLPYRQTKVGPVLAHSGGSPFYNRGRHR